jgi:hypothetical protein
VISRHRRRLLRRAWNATGPLIDVGLFLLLVAIGGVAALFIGGTAS